jgi:general stress protein YciG
MGKQGFASMPPERVAEIASRGGKEVHRLGRGHEFDHESAKVAGKKGGHVVSQDREHMAEIGRKGGRSKAKRAAE